MNKLIEIIKNEFEKDFLEEPFHFLDLGCSGGISPDWRAVEPFLRVIGVDFNVAEVENLNSIEKNPNVQYIAGNLELAPDHPIRAKRGTRFLCESHNAFAKTSAWDAHIRTLKNNTPRDPPPQPSYVLIPELLKNNDFNFVDFIKIDIDGPDFDVLQALENQFQTLEILGFKVEVNFTGTSDPHDHTFHNMDRMMRRNGFELMDLDLRRYTKKALPGKFLFNFFGQTEKGALAQGDAVYVKHTDLKRIGKIKIAKTIVLLTLYGQIDSAAELIKEGPFRDSLRQKWLDYAAQLFSHTNYKDLMEQWEKTPTAFFRDGNQSKTCNYK